MTAVRFGRIVTLETERSSDRSEVRIGLEAVEKATGRLAHAESLEYEGDGISFRKGDVLFGKLRPNLAKAWLADRDGEAVGDFHVYRPIAGRVDSRYLAYVVLSNPFLEPVIASVYGARMPRADWREVRNIEVWAPSLAQQRAIADFLDRETTQIDAFIAKSEELITLLTERRAAKVDALLAESWAEARELKVGWLFTFHNGDRGASYPSRDEFVPAGVPFINAGHLRDGSVYFGEMNYIAEYKFTEMGGAKLRRGDLLFCLRGSVGKLGVFDSERSGSLASSLVAMRARSTAADSRYFAQLLECSRARDAIDLAQTGSAQPNLSVEQLAQLRFPVPSPQVQRDTVGRIEGLTRAIDGAIASARTAIDLARERRAALISAAVTGKISVGVDA